MNLTGVFLLALVCLLKCGSSIMTVINCVKPASIPKPETLPSLHDSFLLLPQLQRMRNDIRNVANGTFSRRVATQIKTRDNRRQGRKAKLTGIDSICEREFFMNYDENRLPEFMLEVRCKRPNIIAREKHSTQYTCEPIKYHYSVYRKSGVDNDGFCTYEQTIEAVTIGCTCINTEFNSS